MLVTMSFCGVVCCRELLPLPEEAQKRYDKFVLGKGGAASLSAPWLHLSGSLAYWRGKGSQSTKLSCNSIAVGLSKGSASPGPARPARRAGDPTERLAMHERSQIEIRRKEVACMAPRQWLNDEVINVYMALLLERDMRLRAKVLCGGGG